MAESEEAVVVAFPIQWTELGWNEIGADPANALDTLKVTVGRMGGRLNSVIPDIATHSVIVAVDVTIGVDEMIEALTRALLPAAEVVSWEGLAGAPVQFDLPDAQVQPGRLAFPMGTSIPEISAALPPQPRPCSRCPADLTVQSHFPDCPFANL